MTMKVLNVSTHTPNDDMNSLGQAIVNKRSLLGSSASDYAISLMDRVEVQVNLLNQTIMEERVRAYSQQYVVEMKTISQNFYRMIASFAAMSSSSVRLSAQTVLAVIEPYQTKLVRSKRQLTVNSNITSMLADLEQDGMTGYLDNIMYANTMLADLKTAQANFIASYADYRDLRSQQVAKANATTLRKSLARLINTELVVYLNAAIHEDADTYGAFADAVASIIKSHKSALKARATRSRNAASEAAEA
ncbi:MAG: hypothetical protein ACK5LR_01385 [Mangrovibacterium sp.]